MNIFSSNIFLSEQKLGKKKGCWCAAPVVGGDETRSGFGFPTHTDRYLNKLSNHHPCQKIGVIKTLFDRAKKVSDPTHLDEELQHLRRSLQANGYSLLEINKVFSSKPKQLREKLPHLGMVFLPYIGGVTDKIGRILERNNIKTIFIPTKKISEFLRSPKDPLDPLTASGVYKILCSCGLVYIGTTKRSFLTRRIAD
ncbi:hypothetical protein RI129_002162 [Pyrocoelia pectoralis]|uniref:Helix-turn-helix domain-containing protein n=1 Tax=Pyrocoelia pectoralis TaxID=417401 RepID=A0AAN7ZHQ3_9COLE